MADASQSVQLLKLKELDDKSVQLQKDVSEMHEESALALPLTQLFILYQGNYLKALTCMEQGLVLRQRLFGTNSEEASSRCAKILVVALKKTAFLT